MPFIADEWPIASGAVVLGQSLTMFSGCDYLGLSHHPDVLDAVRDGLGRYGLAANGSPVTTGLTRAHRELEAALANFTGHAECCLLPDGHLANLAACQALAATHSVALLDERAHDSLVSSARLVGLQPQRYRHCDARDAARRARAESGRVLVMTDSLFGASGSLAPLTELIRALPANATLLIDDGHGTGVLGPGGRGAFASCVHADAGLRKDLAVPDFEVLVTSSLSKGLACYGGAVLGSSARIAAIRSVGAYAGTTPIPPAIAAGVSRAVGVLERDATRVERLRQNAARVRQCLAELGYAVPDLDVPVFCFTADAARTETLERALERESLYVPRVNYANGPATQYFRLAVSAAHADRDVERLLACLRVALG